MSSFSPPSSSLFGLLWLLQSLSPKADMSHKFSLHLLSPFANNHFPSLMPSVQRDEGIFDKDEKIWGGNLSLLVSAHGSSVLGATAATGEDLLDASLEQRRDESCWQR
jgi:hypothetical protein